MSNFVWACHPEAEKLIEEILQQALNGNDDLNQLNDDLLKETSTRLFDWVDHVIIGKQNHIEKKLQGVGFEVCQETPYARFFYHPGAQFPNILVKDEEYAGLGVAVSVESISDFLMVRGRSGVIEGAPYSPYRRSLISTEGGVEFWVVERRVAHLIDPTYPEPGYLEKYMLAREKWATRLRDHLEEEALQCSLGIAEEMVSMVGQELAAWLVMEVERAFWQARNTAGQIQKNRQDRLGMGWANHDHHTFRSSRKYFTQLVRLFEILGFKVRESFFTGSQAGWGAQVMEHPNVRLVLFLDVDMAPDELTIDFAHEPLEEKDALGTIGLWCALHGDSILQAGMHHLEAQFMYDHLVQDLKNCGIETLDPFSKLPYLKQAFTKGEKWAVDSFRIEKLYNEKKITLEQKEKFLKEGAVGSHMENLQRREGFKGFNERSVSTIILQTDPRKMHV